MIFGKKRQTQKREQTRQQIKKITEEISEIWNGEEADKEFDADGSYTGNPDGFDVPVQDADDL